MVSKTISMCSWCDGFDSSVIITSDVMSCQNKNHVGSKIVFWFSPHFHFLLHLEDTHCLPTQFVGRY